MVWRDLVGNDKYLVDIIRTNDVNFSQIGEIGRCGIFGNSSIRLELMYHGTVVFNRLNRKMNFVLMVLFARPAEVSYVKGK